VGRYLLQFHSMPTAQSGERMNGCCPKLWRSAACLLQAAFSGGTKHSASSWSARQMEAVRGSRVLGGAEARLVAPMSADQATGRRRPACPRGTSHRGRRRAARWLHCLKATCGTQVRHPPAREAPSWWCSSRAASSASSRSVSVEQRQGGGSSEQRARGVSPADRGLVERARREWMLGAFWHESAPRVHLEGRAAVATQRWWQRPTYLLQGWLSPLDYLLSPRGPGGIEKGVRE